jgi:osmotically inducible protein OsmC
MDRQGTAVWKGSIKEGSGVVSTASGIVKEAKYSFGTRFENAKGTNPEELIAAAHAGCFSMALSSILGGAGFTPESIKTTATVTVEKSGEGFSITKSHLDVTAKVPGASQAAFDDAANKAKAGCPVSRALSIPITMNAKLEVEARVP